jgi:hypothetical protein
MLSKYLQLSNLIIMFLLLALSTIVLTQNVKLVKDVSLKAVNLILN